MPVNNAKRRVFSRKCEAFSTWCSYLIYFVFSYMLMFPPDSTKAALIVIGLIAALSVITALWAYFLNKNLQLLEGEN